MSKIIKASFVSMSDIRKEIRTIDPRDPNIINPVDDDEVFDSTEKDQPTENMPDLEAIDDDVINGSPSMVLKMAREEAELLLLDARARAEQIQVEAQQVGYDEGLAMGQAASDEALAIKEMALTEEVRLLQEDYVKKLHEKEPEIAAIIMDIVTQLVGRTVVEEDVILYIVRLALEEATALGNFIVRVSPNDYETVMMNSDALVAGLSEKVDVEILKDISLGPNDCLIETDLGMIDGSLKVRMTSLEKELRLIAQSLKMDRKE